MQKDEVLVRISKLEKEVKRLKVLAGYLCLLGACDRLESLPELKGVRNEIEVLIRQVESGLLAERERGENDA